MKKVLMSVSVLLLCASGAGARDLEDILKEKKIIDAVEANEVKAGKEKAAAPELPALPSWLSKITPSGDVRVRNESFFRKNDPDRIRQRFRLRFGIKAKPNDQAELGFRLASGTASDPISNNQSFTDTFTFKSINIAEAYLKLMPAGVFGWARPYFTLMGGKFYTPTYRPTNLLFDNDLTPEGFFETFEPVKTSDSFLRGIALNAGQWIFQESSTRGEGAIYVFQGVASFGGGGVFGNIGVADYIFTKPSLIAVLRNTNTSLNVTNNVGFSDGSVDGGRVVNPATKGPLKDGKDADGKVIKLTHYLSDFNVMNVGADFTIATGIPAFPVKLFGDFIVNTEANGDDKGYYVGLGVGNNKEEGDFEFRYAYAHLETDATISAFSDSDLGRDGGTNTKAHILQVTYVFMKNLSFISTAWIDKPINNVSGRSTETDYRWQVDLVGKF